MVAVVLFLAVGLQGRVARVLEKATVPVSDDGPVWIGSEHHSLLVVESGRVLNLDLLPRDLGCCREPMDEGAADLQVETGVHGAVADAGAWPGGSPAEWRIRPAVVG